MSSDRAEGLTAEEEKKTYEFFKEYASAKVWKKFVGLSLECAAADGDINLFMKLKKGGAPFGAGYRGRHGRTLLGAAAYGGSQPIVRAILATDARGEMEETWGRDEHAPLHVAVERGALAVAMELILAGSDIHVRDRYGMTPLHTAARYGKGEMIHYLLQEGADKEALDFSGRTPLFSAVGSGRIVAINTLLDAGADINVRDITHGESLLDRVCFDSSDTTTKVNKLLLDRGADVNSTRGYDGKTALHHASHDPDDPSFDDSLRIRILLSAGADIEARTTPSGMTPLHFAAQSNEEHVRALVEGGADVNARDSQENTPLHRAVWGGDEPNEEIIDALLRRGADESLVNVDGKTPFDMLDLPKFDGYLCDGLHNIRNIRNLLLRAPRDRAWRRRGWVVMLKSRMGFVFPPGNKGAKSEEELGCLVNRVFSTEDGVFRSIVAFL